MTTAVTSGGNPDSDDEPVGNAKSFDVGAAGGTLNAGELIVEIDAGALTSTKTVTITPLASGTFKVSGLPAALDAPVRFKFPVNAADAIVRVVAENNCYAPSLGKRVDCNDMLTGDYANGYVSATLPANREGKSGQASMQMINDTSFVDRLITLLTDYTSVTSPLGYYRVVVKKEDYNHTNTELIFAAMQASDERFYENQFDMSQVLNPYPIYVFDTVENAAVSGTAGYMLSELENRYISATVLNKETYRTGGDYLTTTVGHEYFHALQVAHMPTLTRYQHAITNLTDPMRVIMEASSTWFERLFSSSEVVPDNEIYFNAFPFYGLTADMMTGSDFMKPPVSTINQTYQVGYGMGLFMHFLTLQSQSYSPVFKIWDAVSNGSEPLQALESVVSSELNDSLGNIWSLFARVHFSGGMESLAGWPHAPESYTYSCSSGGLHTAFNLARYAALSIHFENDKSESSAQRISLSTSGDVELHFLDHTGAYVTSVNDGTLVTIPTGRIWKLIVVSKSQNAYVNIQAEELEDDLQGRFIPQGEWMWAVVDTQTGLMWDMETIGRSFMNWSDAGRYISDSKLGGYNDWRMPKEDELKSLYAAKSDWLETMVLRHQYSWVWVDQTRTGDDGPEALTFRFIGGNVYWCPQSRKDCGRPLAVRNY